MVENETNVIFLVGTICEEPKYSHTTHNEVFYSTSIKVNRLSGTVDILPITYSSKMPFEIKNGSRVSIEGQIRTHNEDKKLIIYVFVRSCQNADEKEEDNNLALISGFVCNKPKYRKTPLGREITDLIVAVNRIHNKSDYLPSICWGRTAKYVELYEVGTKINVVGRLQSREYSKTIDDVTTTRVALELSIKDISIAEKTE